MEISPQALLLYERLKITEHLLTFISERFAEALSLIIHSSPINIEWPSCSSIWRSLSAAQSFGESVTARGK